MRSRLVVALAIIALSTGTALADTSSSADYAGDSSGSSFAWGGVGGLLAAGGAAGLVAGLAGMFGNHSSGSAAVSTPGAAAEAPEISTSGTAAGCALMLGGMFIARGRRRRV